MVRLALSRKMAANRELYTTGGYIYSMSDRIETRKRQKHRINRVSGQITGIARMIDEDRYCLDILAQIAAARSALDQLGVELLTDHIGSCVVGHGTESEHECAKKLNQGELVEEVRKALRQYLKLGTEYTPKSVKEQKGIETNE
jgi:CsoR family transcriptional regulator, copper-sensing transcriptional repressor